MTAAVYAFVSPWQIAGLPTAGVADYCTLGELKGWLRSAIQAGDTALDAVLDLCITDASRIIDNLCGLPAGAFVARTMTRDFDLLAPEDIYYSRDPWNPAAYEYVGYRVPVPPLLTVSALTTDEDGDGTYEVTWASTDYRLDPADGPPYRSITVNPVTGAHAFPPGARRIRVVGSWGVSESVPPPIRRITLELAARKWKRADAPFGVMGSLDTGMIRIGSDEEWARQALAAEGLIDSNSWILA
jgi:hypothetical protein